MNCNTTHYRANSSSVPGDPTDIRDKRGKVEPHLMIDDEEGLLSLIQIGALEIHPWGARADNPDKPDLMIFDMDPAEDVPFKKVIAAAEEARERLESLGLESFVKATGGKGLHVVVPLARRADWPTIKEFAKVFAVAMEADSPDKYISKMSKAARKGKIFVDYLRNDKTSTAVGPYSTRARANAPIATPLHWSELSSLKSSNQYRVDNILERLAKLKKDPWKDIYKTKQSISQTLLKRAA